ncbi:ATP-binding protein [Azospirillum sp.]|uniref:ATP-binding protein n=1 Tax=Azospirillum sp. TaxID=34012 RepID=UPI002D2AB067|nr:ATP-binding protein [Azospirillum sp.]HYD66648.1 ATP-binding protein [Azospirillum sp.]
MLLRRFLPDSIAARTALTVVLALLLTQAISALVYVTDRHEGPPVHGPRVLIERVTAIVQLVESTPPRERPRVVRALDDPVLGVTWSETQPRMGDLKDGFPVEALRRRLRQALADPRRPVFIEVRRPLVGPQPGPLPMPEEMHWSARMRLTVQLTDGTWLSFTGGDPAEGPFRLVRFVLWMVAIGGVIAILSLWAARRLTAPLARFAGAAERLGVDGESDPLPEAGPKELRAATRAFNRMQERLRRFVADRTQMLAAISHDLRTPLTRLRLRAELVDDPEMQRKMLADLDEMEAMITATLAFAREDAQREPRGPLDLADLLQSLCDDRVDTGHDATYRGPAHLAVDGRPVALRRAFANLMDNAIAYGGACRVRLAPEDGQVRIQIDDDGPGIPEAEFEKVFAPFYRLERSRSRDTGGVGLGLSTARSIVRGHGGDVMLANRAEGGLRVTVVLPV